MSGRYSYVGKHPGRTKRSRVLYSLYCVRQRAHSTGGRERPAASGRHSTTRRCATRSSSSCTEAASTLLAQAILWKPTVYLGGVGGLAIQYPERERLHSSREAKTGLLFGQIKVPSLTQVGVQLHELQVLLLLRSLPRAAILLLAHSSFSYECRAPVGIPVLRKMLSSLNAFEISNIQKQETE
jgi:hypothetical protein